MFLKSLSIDFVSFQDIQVKFLLLVGYQNIPVVNTYSSNKVSKRIYPDTIHPLTNYTRTESHALNATSVAIKIQLLIQCSASIESQALNATSVAIKIKLLSQCSARIESQALNATHVCVTNVAISTSYIYIWIPNDRNNPMF